MGDVDDRGAGRGVREQGAGAGDAVAVDQLVDVALASLGRSTALPLQRRGS